jgi:hypothetical protein
MRNYISFGALDIIRDIKVARLRWVEHIQRTNRKKIMETT